MLSLSKYSRSNAVNYEWAEMYLDEAHTKGLVPVRCHCNVLAWAEDEEELRRIKNDTGSQLALMGCVPHYNTIDTPVLYWSGIPGNAGDFPAEESFYTFLEQAVCLFASETNYRSSPSPFGIRIHIYGCGGLSYESKLEFPAGRAAGAGRVHGVSGVCRAAALCRCPAGGCA